MRVLLVGAGRIGSRHADHISEIGDVVGVCDIDVDKGLKLSKKFNAPFFDSLENMLSQNIEADLVAVCTPNGLHAAQSIAALNAGFNVLCEKPMAISVSDCRKMIQVADSQNKKLFVVKQNRFNPPVAAIKNLIESGDLGRIFSVQLSCLWNRNEAYYSDSWRGTKKLDGGILYTQFSHFIDLIVWLFGEVDVIKSVVENVSKRNDIEFEDSCNVLCKLPNGAQATMNFSINAFEQNMEGSITIVAEKGTVKVGGQYLNVLEYQNLKEGKLTDLPEGRPANNYGHYTGSMSNHGLVYRNVLNALNNTKSSLASGLDGLRTVELIEDIYKSAL